MAGELTLEVVTPSRKVLSEACEEVSVPTALGEIGILPDHAALLSAGAAGILQYRASGQRRALVVRGGFVRVFENRVTVLADEAVLPAQIEKTKVETARMALEQKLLDPAVNVEEREELFRERDWLEAQLAVVT